VERPFPAYKGDGPYVFVSYSHDDAELVYPEITRLKDAGFNIWYDEGISPGATWRDEVALALTECKVFLYFVTPRSVASSNCLKEVNFSLSRERRILSVHLEPTELPIGLELSLSDMQAIIKSDLSEAAFAAKLDDALNDLMPRPTAAMIEAPTAFDVAVADDRQSIAVLPLVNRNLESADEYLCDGIAEELINGLARIDGLRVASQTEAFRFKNDKLELKAIGKALGVGAVLSGSLQRAGNRIRINVRLEDVANGALLWSNRYDGEMDDIFELQDDVARKVVEALQVELGADPPEQLVAIGTRNVEAYNSYLLGKHLAAQRTHRSVLQAREQFETALRLDPGFEEANAEAARNVYFNRVFFDRDAVLEAVPRLKRAGAAGILTTPAETMIRELFSETPPPLALAQEALDKLRAGEHGWSTYAYQQVGEALEHVGALRGALAFFDRYKVRTSHQFHPCRLEWYVVNIHAALGEFDTAIDLWSRFIEMQPDSPIHVGERLLLYSRTGQYEKAAVELEKVNAVWPRNFPQFYDLYWRREIDAAKAYFAWLGKRRNLQAWYKVWGYALIGELEKSLDHLEDVAYPPHVSLRRALPASVVEEIERHPRYQAVLKRLHIDAEARDQVLDLVNANSDLTGIQVSLDEAY